MKNWLLAIDMPSNSDVFLIGLELVFLEGVYRGSSLVYELRYFNFLFSYRRYFICF